MDTNQTMIAKLESIDSIVAKNFDRLEKSARDSKRELELGTGAELQAEIEAISNTERLMKIGIVGRVKAGKFFNFSRGRDIATLRESIYQMFDESELLRHIDDKNTKLQFVGNVLNASSISNEAFGKFVSLVENEYAAFANSVSLKEE